MTSNTQHDTGLTADTNREIEPGDNVFSWVYEFNIMSMRRGWRLHQWTVLGFVFVDGDFRPRTDEGVLMHPCFDSRRAAESFGHPDVAALIDELRRIAASGEGERRQNNLLFSDRYFIRKAANELERLTARIAELESKLVDERISAASEYWELEARANDRIAELEGQVAPRLARNQPCGCVVCTCEDEIQCHGCGANHCGTHPIGEIPNPVYEQTWQDQLAQAAKAERAKIVAELEAESDAGKIGYHEIVRRLKEAYPTEAADGE